MRTWTQFLEQKTNQLQHDRLVMLLAEYYKDAGFHVLASIPGYEQVKKLKYVDRIPDVRAFGEDTVIIGEAETAAGLDYPHTEEQWKDFRVEVSQTHGAHLAIIVPESALEKAKERAAAWGIHVEYLFPVPDENLPRA